MDQQYYSLFSERFTAPRASSSTARRAPSDGACVDVKRNKGRESTGALGCRDGKSSDSPLVSFHSFAHPLTWQQEAIKSRGGFLKRYSSSVLIRTVLVRSHISTPTANAHADPLLSLRNVAAKQHSGDKGADGRPRGGTETRTTAHSGPGEGRACLFHVTW